jgi:hypothetical protein
MELVEALLNPESSGRLGRALKAAAQLQPGVRAMMAQPPPNVQPPQGQLLRAIKVVLAGRPDGLRTVEVWRLVEDRLGREVSYSAIKTDLASNAVRDGCFERLRRGVYRLRSRGQDQCRP